MAHHALLIGINRYPRLPFGDLQGCVGDMELMRSLLVDRFGFPAANTRSLSDLEATRQAVLDALAGLEAAVGEGDTVVFFFAGHGSRLADPRRPGGFVESLVPHDSGRGELPNLDVLDEEIDRWVQRVNEKTPHVTLIFDCCHSGSVTRDPFGARTREAPADLRPLAEMFGGRPVPAALTVPRAADAADSGAGWLPGRRRAVVIAACRAHELANEHQVFTGEDLVQHGAFTFFLSQALLQARPGASWRDVFEQASPKVTALYETQHPQIEGRMDLLLFGTGEVRPASFLAVQAAGGGAVELAGGAVHGVRVGSLWTVRPPGARHAEDGEEVAAAEVCSVRAATSTARVVGAAELAATDGLRAFLRELRLDEPGLRVAVDAAGEPRERFLAALAREPLLRERPEEADVLVRCLEPRGVPGPGSSYPGLGPLAERTWAAVGRDGRLAVRTRPDRPEEVWALLSDLVLVARYRQLLDLGNPDPASRLAGRVHLRVLRWDPGPGVFAAAVPEAGAGMPVFREGEKAEFEIVNGHEAAVWVSLVEFGCDRRIALLMPRPGHAVYTQGGMRLEPGETVRVAAGYFRQDPSYGDAMLEGLPLQLPPGFPWAAEPGQDEDLGIVTLKLFVTLASADFEFLEQGATRPLARHPLERLALLYSNGRGERSSTPRPAATAPDLDWATVTLSLGVRRED